MRANNRSFNEMRKISIVRNYSDTAEGSALIEFGNTKLLCTASVISGVPRFLKDTGQGWITAEYGMLPRATQVRTDREAVKGKQHGRTIEIQRLIGRALRAAIDMEALGENTIVIDCDVVQADGGTRCAAITGGCVALFDAVRWIQKNSGKKQNIFSELVAAVSVGICQNEVMLDLDYSEDSSASTDMNVVMTQAGNFIEIQGTAERGVFTQSQLNELLNLAKYGLEQLISKQRQILNIG